jgi:hypothetical protein
MGSGLHRTENGFTDLLIWFAPQNGCRVAHLDRSRTNIWQTLPQQIQYVWQGLAAAGQKLSFSSVLWPHKPDRDPSKLAARLESMAAGPDLAVVRAKITDDTAYLLVINDTGKAQTAGGLATDARLAVVYEVKGKPAEVMIYQGTAVDYDGRPILRLDKPQTTQKGVKQP